MHQGNRVKFQTFQTDHCGNLNVNIRNSLYPIKRRGHLKCCNVKLIVKLVCWKKYKIFQVMKFIFIRS